MAEVKFDCPLCKQSLEAPEDMAGELIACPKCEQGITVPWGDSVKLPELPKYCKCPFCAEQILHEAIKCRFCGEYLDGNSVKQPEKVIVKQSQEGCFLQTMNAGCVIVFLVFCLIVIFFFLGGC